MTRRTFRPAFLGLLIALTVGWTALTYAISLDGGANQEATALYKVAHMRQFSARAWIGCHPGRGRSVELGWSERADTCSHFCRVRGLTGPKGGLQ